MTRFALIAPSPFAIILFAAIMAMLGACSTQPIDTQDDVVALSNIVLEDLKTAKADADVHDDIIASTCYAALIKKVEELPTLTAGRVVGPISGFQKARNARRRMDVGISDEVHVACAALASDTRVTVLRVLKLINVAI